MKTWNFDLRFVVVVATNANMLANSCLLDTENISCEVSDLIAQTTVRGPPTGLRSSVEQEEEPLNQSHNSTRLPLQM